jgi:hypothetical protein
MEQNNENIFGRAALNGQERVVLQEDNEIEQFREAIPLAMEE